MATKTVYRSGIPRRRPLPGRTRWPESHRARDTFPSYDSCRACYNAGMTNVSLPDEWLSAVATRNYLSRDPIVDWLEVHVCGAADRGITADNKVDYKVMMEILALSREQHSGRS